MNHTASKRFWACLERLQPGVQELAHKNFALLRADPGHPSLQFKPLGAGKLCSARVGLHHRALGMPKADGVHWFWIGSHADYDRLIG